MRSHGRISAPAGVVALIAAVTVVPLAVFLWLGVRLLDQDWRLEEQQVRDRLQTGVDLVVAKLQRTIGASEQRLAEGRDDWPDGAIAVTFSAAGVEVVPAGRIAFLPVLPALREVPAEPFRGVDVLEFQNGDRPGAIAAYRRLAASPDRAVRSGALLRLARNLDAVGRHPEALAIYADLQSVVDIVEAGVPLGLAASWARCSLLQRLNREDDLRTEASRLHQDLSAGRWPVLEPAYVTYFLDAERWAGRPRVASPAEIFSAAVSALWRERTGGGFGAASGRRRWLTIGGQELAVIAQPTGNRSRVLVATRAFVASQWLEPVAAVANEQALTFELRDSSGREIPFAMTRPSGAQAPSRSPLTISVNGSVSELPWQLVASSIAAPQSAGFVKRRRLMFSGFALIAVLTLAASWLILRAVTREVAVARLQSDFVAAVSHEFRTPLTALRQFTDMLREQSDLDADRRRLCYDVQSRATDRLARLVESVLDFGRMEAGARPYHFEPRDCAELVQRVVDDFRVQPQASGHRVEFERNGSIPIDADDEALSRAVWNLLDNAVKYSPDRTPIEVTLVRRAAQVAISVRDRGLGIPPHEQRSIFQKFQRGDAARDRGIAGTGIGLAMVDQIIRAHGGRVGVESDPGAGSTFTILLPVKG
jgi:signal transduction histidine kinase